MGAFVVIVTAVCHPALPGSMNKPPPVEAVTKKTF